MKDVLEEEHSLNIENKQTTCFVKHKNLKLACENIKCRQWIQHEECYNCTIISAESGPKTLQEIGDMFGITRMRICQIEKTALSKLIKKI